ncbi:MAG: bifunctional riboflavin kinase/FAD synthetase [Deltaproteobacteria bacterium]|nr:bifunctional riboflavin kinase/FAD synthetase [Deltaproteobacteria bacterium]
MKVIRNTTLLREIKTPVLTLGNFDGLHIGHKRILEKVVGRARLFGCPSVVYTFEPHPLKVVAPEKSPPLLIDTEDKIKLIEETGIDCLIFAKFTRDFAATHPREFVKDILVGALSVKEVWVGQDFSFGRGKAGTVGYLKELGAEFGFKVFAVPAYRKGGGVISSSRIRAHIKEGEVDKAASLLGRRYNIKGKVVRGKDIGKDIGFPTANLEVTSELVPADGVYAAYAALDDKRYPAVLNIGKAPTFGGKDRCVEVHILDFKGDIYGKTLEVSFVKRLRDEIVFKSKEALVARIEKDTKRARRILVQRESPAGKAGDKG